MDAAGAAGADRLREDDAMSLRYLIGATFAAVVTFALFHLMQALIASDRNPLDEASAPEITEFARVIEERPPKVVDLGPERPVPPELPPQPDEPDLPTDTPRIGWIPPERDPGPRPKIEPRTPVSEGEYLPVVKVAPVYPRRALTRGIEGYVVVEFTVTRTGAVRDPVVVEAEPRGIFDRAARDAARKFKYKPRVVDGEPVEVHGVRNVIRFRLDDG